MLCRRHIERGDDEMSGTPSQLELGGATSAIRRVSFLNALHIEAGVRRDGRFSILVSDRKIIVAFLQTANGKAVVPRFLSFHLKKAPQE